MDSIVVIGAGVSGLVAALRLQQSGHHVTILEGKPHAGGLSQTVRNGSVLTECADGGPIQQTCTLPPGRYINAGPGRLPHHHRRILRLCRELGVSLEPYTMSSDSNYYLHSSSGKVYRRRRIEHDTRGWIAQRAYAAAGKGRERHLVRAFGDLDDAGRYQGTQRAGEGDILSRGELARLGHWDHLFNQPSSHLWQDSMFQPVGGMDRIWRAVLAELDRRKVEIRYNAAVTGLITSADGVRVQWQESRSRRRQLFDWCASTIPLPTLAEDIILRGFSDSFHRAVEVSEFAPACKLGWYSKHRWWEDDDRQCYGGISYTDHIIAQFWYPSYDYFSDDGTLTGCYNSYESARQFGGLDHFERIELARKGGAQLHTEIGDEDVVPTGRAVSVAWHKVPHQRGGWCHWDPVRPEHSAAFNRLQEPDGRYIVIGDQVSQWPGWQEGALQSAYRAVDLINGDTAARRFEPAGKISYVPDSFWLTQGDHPAGQFQLSGPGKLAASASRLEVEKVLPYSTLDLSVSD